MDDLVAFWRARLDEDEAAARDASGGTVVGEPGNWKPAPGGDEWEAHADLTDGDFGVDGSVELLVALCPGLPRPPEMAGGYWGTVVSWQANLADRDAWIPEPQFRHIARHDPARTLREVAADRKILARYEHAVNGDLPEWQAGRELLVAAAAILRGVAADRAAVYSGHPDYRQEWKP